MKFFGTVALVCLSLAALVSTTRYAGTCTMGDAKQLVAMLIALPFFGLGTQLGAVSGTVTI